MRADCIAAGSSGLARAQAMLTGETYSCSQRNDRKASVARCRCVAPCKLRQKQKGVNHGPFVKPPPRCTVALRWKHQRRNLLACKRRRAVCCVHTVQVHEAGGPKPRPDVQHTPRGAAHAERSACASRGPTAAARCRPDRPARPRGGGGGRACLARARAGEEHLVRGGGVSGASASEMRGLCDRGARRGRRPPARASSRSRGTGRAAASCPRRRLSSRAAGGLGRSWPGAFGRPKNKSGARPAHRARDAARAARGRRAAQQICVFEAAAPRSGGRAVRRGARARRARVASGAGPPGGARGAAPAGGRARTGRWRRPARRGAGAGRRHFRCSLCFITVDTCTPSRCLRGLFQVLRPYCILAFMCFSLISGVSADRLS